MHITVASRMVARPWDRARVEGTRAISVGLEDYLEPEPGPLARYLSAWPTRRVRWHRQRQVWEITDRADPAWRELVSELDAPPDPATGEARSMEELAAMVQAGSHAVVRVFRHFDYPFVLQRLHEREQFERHGSEGYGDAVMEANRKHAQRPFRANAHKRAAVLADTRRWWPVLAGDNPGARTPLVPGGFTK
jgi:hypothetical protein